MTLHDIQVGLEELKNSVTDSQKKVLDGLKASIQALFESMECVAVKVPDYSATGAVVPGRVVVHVTPTEKGRWKVQVVGSSKKRSFEDKSDALVCAKKLAKGAALGQVVVHRSDGQIQIEYTYGSDPVKVAG